VTVEGRQGYRRPAVAESTEDDQRFDEKPPLHMSFLRTIAKWE
jgi:hypothetical protein